MADEEKAKHFNSRFKKVNSNGDVVLETIRPDSYNFSYTCLLIPNDPANPLTNDAAENLRVLLQQICATNGWALEFATVESDYLQWSFSVLSSIPAIQFMQLIRDQTSKAILSTLPDETRESLNNEFWAPGYLVVLGIRPHSEDMIRQYIRMTRRQQGKGT